jgi:type III restriction enzyme
MKCGYLDEYVRAINEHGGFGTWSWAVSKDPADVAGIIERAASEGRGQD